MRLNDALSQIADIRQQYPQYNDMSDADLADALHQKFYSDMPKQQFSSATFTSCPSRRKPPTPDFRSCQQ